MPQTSLRTHALEQLRLWSGLSVGALDLDAYNQRYVDRYRYHLRYNAYLAQHLVDAAHLSQEPEEVIDLGGGIGFNTTYLRLRFPSARICYVDVDPESTKAAQMIHKALGMEGIEYFCGELSELGNRIGARSFICSRDVIEHIYDLEAFFQLSKQAMANAHNTSAIHGSWFRHREFARIHAEAELVGHPEGVKKSRDNRKSYLSMRTRIIEEAYPDLNSTAIHALATSSRGLNFADIQRFVSSGVYPQALKSCLYDNSCDPYTGNWAERCIRPRDYRALAADVALCFRYPAYNTYQTGWKRFALYILNGITYLPIHRIQASFTLVYTHP